MRRIRGSMLARNLTRSPGIMYEGASRRQTAETGAGGVSSHAYRRTRPRSVFDSRSTPRLNGMASSRDESSASAILTQEGSPI